MQTDRSKKGGKPLQYSSGSRTWYLGVWMQLLSVARVQASLKL